jgi:hypothetical protein
MNTKHALILISALIFFTCRLDAAWSDDPNYRHPFPVPNAPPGSSIVIYGPIPLGLGGDKGEKIRDWRDILKNMGVDFPPEGFALFYKPARVLVVATNKTNHYKLAALTE